MRTIQRTETMPPPDQFVVMFRDRSVIDLVAQINEYVESYVVKIDSQSITVAAGRVFAMVVFSEQKS